MDDTTLTVFISSKMQELAAERTTVYDLLTQLGNGPLQIKAWAYEKDAHAASYPIRDVYLKILEESALYIGLFWKAYGEWTIDEFRRATEWHIDRLLFVKSDERDNREAKLNQFLDEVAPVDKGLAPIWFTDVDDLRGKVEHSLKVWINEKLTYRPGSANAVLVTDPDDVPHQPRKLIGRDDLLAQLRTALAQNSRVLLQGFGGMGKTALAATAAAEYLKSNPGPLLWQEIGKESSDAIFEALARPMNAVQQIAREHGDAKIQAMRSLLRQTGVKLVVLDNAWDGPALKTVLEAVPRDVPVIVTSRHAYPLDMRMEVDELSPTSAVETLAFYAGNPTLQQDPAAAELCQLLGYLAFALEIAGKQLMVDKLTPAQLKTRIESAPHELEMPLEFATEGHRRFADLMETSLAVLDEETRKVYLTLGAFFSRQITPEMLRLYELVQSKIIDDTQIIIPYLLFDIDTTRTEVALNKLMPRSLIRRIGASGDRVASYRIHDLAYTYLKAQLDDDISTYALDACLTYTELHNKPTPENFAALLPELDNFLGAITWAYTAGFEFEVERFAVNLWSTSEFMSYQGLFEKAVTLLTYAVYSAKHRGSLWDESAHLSHLATAYQNLSDYSTAIVLYEQSLTIARKIGNKGGECNQLGSLGNVNFYLGNYEKAIDLLQRSLDIARLIRDKRGEGNSLSGLGVAHRALGNYQQAIDLFQQSLDIARQIGDRRSETNQLGNLGNAHANLGDYPKSIYYNEQALIVARQIRDKRAEGNWLGNLGSLSIDLGDYPKADYYYEQALAIMRQIHNKRGEGDALGGLGLSRANLGDYTEALEYYQKARDIFVLIGVKHKVEWIDGLVARVEAKLAGNAADTEPPPPAE